MDQQEQVSVSVLKGAKVEAGAQVVIGNVVAARVAYMSSDQPRTKQTTVPMPSANAKADAQAEPKETPRQTIVIPPSVTVGMLAFGNKLFTNVQVEEMSRDSQTLKWDGHTLQCKDGQIWLDTWKVYEPRIFQGSATIDWQTFLARMAERDPLEMWVDTAYLEQNKWIDLGRTYEWSAAKEPWTECVPIKFLYQKEQFRLEIQIVALGYAAQIYDDEYPVMDVKCGFGHWEIVREAIKVFILIRKRVDRENKK
jgi:hypothetical protein